MGTVLCKYIYPFCPARVLMCFESYCLPLLPSRLTSTALSFIFLLVDRCHFRKRCWCSLTIDIVIVDLFVWYLLSTPWFWLPLALSLRFHNNSAFSTWTFCRLPQGLCPTRMQSVFFSQLNFTCGERVYQPQGIRLMKVSSYYLFGLVVWTQAMHINTCKFNTTCLYGKKSTASKFYLFNGKKERIKKNLHQQWSRC